MIGRYLFHSPVDRCGSLAKFTQYDFFIVMMRNVRFVLKRLEQGLNCLRGFLRKVICGKTVDALFEVENIARFLLMILLKFLD